MSVKEVVVEDQREIPPSPKLNCLPNSSGSGLTDVGVLGQDLVAAVSLRDAVSPGKVLGSRRAPGRNGSDLCEVRNTAAGRLNSRCIWMITADVCLQK